MFCASNVENEKDCFVKNSGDMVKKNLHIMVQIFKDEMYFVKYFNLAFVFLESKGLRMINSPSYSLE